MRFARKALGFCAPLLALALIYEWTLNPVLRYGLGPTSDMEYLIRRSAELALKRDYELVVIGDSRLFRGVDPSQLSIPSQNFAFDDDTFNYYYYKLKWLVEHGKRPRYAVLGVAPELFAYMNYDRYLVYRGLLGDPELSAFLYDPVFAWRFLENYAGHRLAARGVYRNALLGVGRQLAGGERPSVKDDPRTRLRDDGYFYFDLPPIARPDDQADHWIGRRPELTQALVRAVDYCRAQGIQPFLFMAPMRDIERAVYSPAERDDFARLIAAIAAPDDIPVLDYSQRAEFQLGDFYDLIHLTPAGARKLTRLLDADIRARITKH